MIIGKSQLLFPVMYTKIWNIYVCQNSYFSQYMHRFVHFEDYLKPERVFTPPKLFIYPFASCRQRKTVLLTLTQLHNGWLYQFLQKGSFKASI